MFSAIFKEILSVCSGCRTFCGHTQAVVHFSEEFAFRETYLNLLCLFGACAFLELVILKEPFVHEYNAYSWFKERQNELWKC